MGTNTKRVAKVVGFGSSLSTTLDAARKSFQKASDWAVEDPLRAATTGVSMAIGAGLGVVFTGISSHWLFNSAIPTWSVKKLAENFDGYLKRREDLIEKGQLTDADAERIKFERDIARRIGAPLLGARLTQARLTVGIARSSRARAMAFWNASGSCAPGTA